MSTPIAQEIENLSILLVMQEPGDLQGFALLEDMFDGAKKEAAKDPALKAVEQACDDVLAQAKTLNKPALLKLMNDTVCALQAMIRSEIPPQTISDSGTVKDWGKDLAPNFDQELSVELIEKHRLGMEDLESQLVTLISGEPPPEAVIDEIHGAVKAYLHTLKGDCGAVGFNGIERVTHFVEDFLVSRRVIDFVEELLTFREWTLNVFTAFVDKKIPTVSAASFMDTFAVNEPTESVAVSSDKVEKTQSKFPATYTLEGEADILVEFIAEAEDHLSALEERLLSAEPTTVSREDLDFIFRAVHSLKGGSAYFQILETMKSSHLLENLLDRCRNGAATFDETLYRICLAYVDIQRDILGRVKATINAPAPISFKQETVELIDRIELFNAAKIATPVESQPTTVEVQSTPKAEKVVPPVAPASTTPASAPPVAATQSSKPSESKPAAKTSEATEVKNFVKVDTQRLDLLIEYIGEMVISSSMLIQANRTLMSTNEAVVNNCHQLEQITREIQSIGMSMRLVPIKGLFQKMGRLVWDTSKKLGKDVNFKMDGEDTELDRTVIEKIADPLMHMVRNSLDHGLEGPEDRLTNGKIKTGTIELSAYHSGGAVFVRIKDDGRGLNQEVIVRKAKEKGVIAEDAKLTEYEIFQLIFAPGFSTAAQVTDISGRGVGMDVVKRNIEEMRGRIHIESTPGRGSTFTVELPLTLAILDGIAAVVGTERLIIPALSVIEFLKPPTSMISHTLDRGETLSFRGEYLPIFRIGTLFGIEGQREKLEECIIVVVEGNGEQVALVVDDVVGKLPAVIKNLGSMFRHVKGLAGCAVMSDGGVGLIVDVNTLVELARSERNHSIRRALPSQNELRIH